MQIIPKLEYMLADLQKYNHSKEELLEFYIQKRLDSSFMIYYKDLNYQLNYLKTRESHNERAKLKILNQINSKEDS